MEETLQPRIKVVIGLGNPGKRFDKTRHNLGFEVVDLLRGKSEFVAGKGSYFSCETEVSSLKVVLLKPTTYMNLSGIAVREFADQRELKPEEMLVISDDFNLSLGRIRLRQSGSDGGHNGLASITYHLSSENFPRIRLGIGPMPDGMPPEEFVLEKFTEGELPAVRDMIARTAEAAAVWLAEGYEKTAARFNRALLEN
jgi:peptidyl-tRNA hydrolase, PTH1 family